MSKQKMQTNYVSPLDEFLLTFDREHPGLSVSQQKEKAKFDRIYRLRDVANRPDETKLPDDF